MSLPDEALKAFDAAVTEVGVRNILLVDRLRGAMARALVAPQPSANTAPADPMDWPLPCDVKVGHGTMRKGVALRTLVARMKVLYEMATGEDADRVANRTPEKRAALIADFQRAIAAAQPATAPADHAPAGAEAEAATDAALGLVTLPPIRVDRATHAALQESAKARGVVLQAIVRERLAPYLMPLQPATAPVVPALPEPYATSVTWRNAEGGSWQQWHDAEDPMPAEWDGRPPDEVVHVYTEAQVRAMLAAAPAAPVVPQPAAQQGEADRDVKAELICAEDVLDSYAAGLDLEQTHFECVGDYIKAVVERLRHSVDFYQRRCDLLQQWQSRMRDPERTIVCDILANAQMLPDPTGARYGAQQGEAVAPDGRLHADGYFTWSRRDGYVLDRRLPCDFFLAPPARQAVAQHPDDEAVDQFAALLKTKLSKARAKGRSGWRDPSWPAADINAQLQAHQAKGDPLDVAAYAMFLALRGEATTARQAVALTEAAADVLAERRRQIEAEGWTPEHDDEHTFGELVQAAADLCVHGTDFRVVDLDGDRMLGWGLTEKHSHDRRRQLVIAAALILAEIERLDRAHGITTAAKENGNG